VAEGASRRQIAARLGVAEESLSEQIRRLGRAPARPVQAPFFTCWSLSRRHLRGSAASGRPSSEYSSSNNDPEDRSRLQPALRSKYSFLRRLPGG
jgi:hypothetical protein